MLLVSAELMKSSSSDRIAMYRGKITATVTAEEATKEFIRLLMAGIPVEQARERVHDPSQKFEPTGCRMTNEERNEKPTTNRTPSKSSSKFLRQTRGGDGQENGSRLTAYLGMLVIPVLAVITGLFSGAIFIILTTEEVYAAFGNHFGGL